MEFGPTSASSALAWRVLDPGPNEFDLGLQTRLSALQANEMTTVIVTLRQQANLAGLGGGDRKTRSRNIIQKLKSTADGTQKRVKTLLTTRRSQNKVKSFEPLWVINGFSVTATSAVINELASQPDVLSITPDRFKLSPHWAPRKPIISLISAPALWDLGYSRGLLWPTWIVASISLILICPLVGGAVRIVGLTRTVSTPPPRWI